MVAFYTFIFYAVQSLYRSKFIQRKIYTVQNLYGHFLYRSKLIQFKIYTLQNLYWRKKPSSAPNLMAQSFGHFTLFLAALLPK
jgi:hypothetical protein